MPSLLHTLAGTLRGEIAQHRNRSFLEATMAACALVAIADGEVRFSERHRMDEILENLEQLRIFDAHEAVGLFDRHIKALRDDLETDSGAGARAATEAIKGIAGDPDASLLLLRVCIAISGADGEYQPAEQACIERIAESLGVPAEECRRQWLRGAGEAGP